MTLHLFSIYDLKAFAFIPPFTLATPEMAIRAFSEAANDPLHMFCKFPTDFNLFHIGEFDDSLGDLIKYETCVNLGLANQYKQGEI